MNTTQMKGNDYRKRKGMYLPSGVRAEKYSAPTQMNANDKYKPQ